MTKEQIVEKYRQDRQMILSNDRMSQVDKDIAIYRKWRIYINEVGDSCPLKQESAAIILTHNKK